MSGEPSEKMQEEMFQDEECYVFPASDSQKRLWFLDELIPNSPAYNLSFPLRMRGRLNQQALVYSLNEIVMRHESLRTRFLFDEGELVQVVSPAMELHLPVREEAGLADSERAARADELACAEARQPFSLSKGPLIRAALVRFDSEDHVLLLSIHHIISDGWSIEIFFKELEVLYAAFCQGQNAGLADLEIQYGDYAVWQKEWLQSEEFSAQMQYWRERLRGHQPLLELPTDRPRQAKRNAGGGSYDFEIPVAVSSRLDKIAQAENVTNFMLYLTAVQVFLYRYSGQDDFNIGTLNANRNQPGLEDVFGFFANTLVHRAQIKQGITFRECLRQVQQECLEVLSNAKVPFDNIVEEVCEERSVYHTPLFQVLFECMNESGAECELALPDLDITVIDTPGETSKFDLSLYIRTGGEACSAQFEYSSDLFDRQTIQRMADHFLVLLDGIASEPDQSIELLPLLTAQEWAEVEARVPAEGEQMEASTCIHARFEAQVQRTPDAVAVECEERALTYRELNEQANRLARFLQSKGVQSEDLVVLCLDRSVEMIVAILGVLKAGAAYVPVDPDSPAERTRFLLEDANATILLTMNQERADLPERLEVVDLAELLPQLNDYPVANLTIDVQPSNLAYVIYTSGSTGKPKGVLIEHGSVHRLFAKTEHWYEFGAQDVWTMFHSYAFDFSVWEIWGALFYGGRLVVVPYWVSRSPETFYQLIVERGVTVLNQTPSNFRQLIQVDQQLQSASLQLRYVIFGGEALDFRMLQPWFQRHGDRQPQLVNMYGITETTVHVTYRVIRMQDASEAAGSRIGVPIPDLNAYVLDAHLQPMPTGVYGELYVEGAGLARGYLNRPELTAERFLTHAFGEGSKRRLYKTGDVGRWLPSGELEYRGRADTQVKIRGFRIELDEIKSILRAHPDVTDAVVVVKTFPGGSKGLAGYVVTVSEGVQLRTDMLRGFLAEKLPAYMVPAMIMPIESIPLTINGKVDVRALPEPKLESRASVEAGAVPSTPEEALMADIWARVLHLERVGVTDNYFELGGDSIRSLQILYQAREAGLDFNMQDLFKHQTVRSLVQALQQSGQTKEAAAEIDWLTDGDRDQLGEHIEDAYPLSQSQLGMLYHSKFESGSQLYHNVHSFRLQATYSEQAWRKAVQELVVRHPILRTSFDLINYSQPMQLVQRSVEVPLIFHDIRAIDANKQEEILESFMQSECNRPFDWTEAPIIRFAIHRLGEDTFQLGITEHHAILDGWSVATMQHELFQLYLHHMGIEADLPEPPRAAYREFIRLEQRALRSGASKAYWAQQMAGATVNALPRWHPQSGTSGVPDMTSKSIDVPQNLSRKLTDLAHQLQVAIKSVLLAAHLRVISLICNQTDVVTGVVFNGRPEQRDAERVLGMFLNTLPFRGGIPSGSWGELVRSVMEWEQETLAHRHYPLAQIQQDQGGHELFETFFNFTNFHVLRSVDDNQHLDVLDESSHALTSFAFGAEFGLKHETSDVRLDLRWDQSQFSEQQIDRIAGYYLAVLSAMTSDVQGSCREANFLCDEERRLLEAWNKTEKDYPVRCLHDLFEEQVRKTPERIALHFEGIEWTFAELNSRANAIARALKERGVGREVRVGLLFDRSLELIASLCGTLKAGGAYVPLDPESPTDRLAFLFEDAQLSVLLTQRKWRDSLPPTEATVLVVEDLLENATRDAFVCDPFDPDSLAYIIYTSGTTGKPKGAMITHRNISNRILWMQEQYQLTPDDAVLQKTPYSFDVSVWEFFWPLVTGTKLVIARPGGHKEPTYLAGLIAAQRVTTIHFVPSMLSLFVEEAAPEACRSLRQVFCSGEALPLQLQKAFFARYSAGLHNLYGPTEAAVDVTYWECRSDIPWKSVPIGRPVANTQMHILDDRLQTVPIGTPGELFIGGVQVGRGYHNREEMTRDRFIADPFRAGGRLYKTGDLARFLPDGNIEYLGRNDDQVKIRGMRIELGEIEQVLTEHPAVREAVVMAQQGANGDPHLVAYAVAEPERREDIEGHLHAKLPLYMVPHLVLIERIPVNHNGKADRKALAALGWQPFESRQHLLIAPRNELEAELVQIWEEILNHSPIGIQDPFFQIGGNSIAAVRLMSRITKRYGCELPLSILFQQATIQELAAVIRGGTVTDSLHSPLVTFTTDAKALDTLFLVHPIGGSTFCYAGLVKELGQAINMYGLQSLGLDGTSDPQSTVEEMAASYLRAMRTVQPEGPYSLGGWSFGGVIAYEMACQLQAAGEDITFLAFFDSFAPVDLNRRTDWREEELLRSFVRDLLGLEAIPKTVSIEGVLEAQATLASLLPSLRQQDSVLQDIDEQRMQRMYQVFQANVRAEGTYTPQTTLQVPTLLVLANGGGLLAEDDPTLGWDALIDTPIQRTSVEGDHYSMLREPHLRAVSEAVRRAFQQAHLVRG